MAPTAAAPAAAAPAEIELRGRVRDAATGALLEGVQLLTQPHSAGAVTGQDGSFCLLLPPGDYALSLFRTGYHSISLQVEAAAGRPPLEIALTATLLLLHQEVTVTAERDLLASYNSPAAITTLAVRSADQPLPRSTPEALMGSQGLFVQKSNHGGGSPFIRGLTGNQVLTLIDGIRLNNATFRYGPNQYLNTIDPYSIDRIEVLRGYGGTLYGSDAMGGLLNLLTPDLSFAPALRPALAFTARYMSSGMEKGGHVDMGLSSPRLSLLASLSGRDFGDLRAGRGVGVQSPSGYGEGSGQVKAALQLGRRALLTALWQKVRQSQVPALDQVVQRGYALYQYDPQARQLAYLRLAAVSDNPLWRQFEITVFSHASEESRERQKRESAILTREEDRVRTLGLQMQAHTLVHRHWRMVYGMEWYHDRVASHAEEHNSVTQQTLFKRGLYPDGARSDNLAFYCAHIIDFERLSLHAGSRYNLVRIEIDDPLFGRTRITPAAMAGHLSLVHPLGAKWNLMVNATSSFRAPNINDLSTFGPFDYGIEVPVASLAPEKGYTLEAGMKHRSSQSSAALFFYQSWLHDMIARIEGSYQGSSWLEGERVYHKANIQRAIVRGVETEGEWQFSKYWRLGANLNYCWGENLSDDEPMRRIPPLHGRLQLVCSAGRGWSWTAEWQSATAQTRLAAGDLADHRIPSGGTPGWNVVNWHAGWRQKRWSLSGGVINLMDKAYKTHGSGIYMPGRTAWLALQLQWGR